MNIKEKANAVVMDVPAIWLALKDPETPKSAKLFAWLTVGYFLSPIDVVPDILPFLGYIDDFLIIPLLADLTIKRIPPDIMARCREQSRDIWSDGKPTNWKYAVPAIVIWGILIIWLGIKALDLFF